MDVKLYLQQVREHYPELVPELLADVSLSDVDEYDSAELNWRWNTFRYAVVNHLKKDFTEQDRPFIRHLLMQEIICIEREMDSCDSDYFEMVAQMLFYIGNVEDVPLFWQAKWASFDASLQIDASYFFGAGFDETIQYAKGLEIEDKAELLEYLVDSIDEIKSWFPDWKHRIYDSFERERNSE